jgi:hypothetical protein
MKKLVVLLVMVLVCATAFAQSKTRVNAIRVDSGYVALTKSVKATAPVATGKTYTDSKGVKFPVYRGAKGGEYINRVSSKTGKTYRMYIHTK